MPGVTWCSSAGKRSWSPPNRSAGARKIEAEELVAGILEVLRRGYVANPSTINEDHHLIQTIWGHRGGGGFRKNKTPASHAPRRARGIKNTRGGGMANNQIPRRREPGDHKIGAD